MTRGQSIFWIRAETEHLAEEARARLDTGQETWAVVAIPPSADLTRHEALGELIHAMVEGGLRVVESDVGELGVRVEKVSR